jgi:hypothetical protein
MKKHRSPSKFLDGQKILEEKHKIYLDHLIKMHNDEIYLNMKARPAIT